MPNQKDGFKKSTTSNNKRGDKESNNSNFFDKNKQKRSNSSFKSDERPRGKFGQTLHSESDRSSSNRSDGVSGDRKFGDRQDRPFRDKPFGEKKFGDRQDRPFRDKPFGEKKFGDRQDRPFRDKPFGEKKFGDRQDRPFRDKLFGEKKFGDSQDRPFRDKPFGEKKFGDSQDRPFRDKPFGEKKFGDRQDRPFRDKPFGDRKSNKPIEKSEPKISLEYVLNYFHKHDVVDIYDVQNQIVGENSDTFFSKVNLLINKNIIEIAGENKLKLNSSYLNDSLCEYSYIKIKSQLIGNHYLVSISPLDKKQTSEEEIIIEDLKENLQDRIILSKLKIENEKIIASPIFYLNDLSENDIKQVEKSGLIRGIYQNYDNIDVIIPVNIKSRRNINLSNIPENLKVGDVIEARFTSKPDDSTPEAIFVKIISSDNSATTSSMLSVYQYDLPYKFSDTLQDIAKKFEATPLGTRRDLRHIPLVTIDDDDAKDFDDAIYACPVPTRENTYQIYVAIADVSHYIKPKEPLDIEAQLRGNSVYLPGFVIPMLPKELSNGWCSLNPNEDRGCLVMEGIVNRNGELESFDFYRGLMKSHARLTYSEVANAIDGEVSEKLQPLMENIINPLKSAFLLLDMARKKRNALDINSTESKFILDENENILDVITKESLISHKIVEEFMISANVATAKFISKAGLAQSGLAIYRIHAKPSLEKIITFTGTLKSFGLNIKAPDNATSGFFNNMLTEFKNKPTFNSLNEAILRCQSQAEYSNENIGHFGLALKEYCHFTSPIRRYSDLMIHRLILSIIDGNEHFNYSSAEVSNIAKSISLAERLAFNAEKSAKNRVFAKWLSYKIGESFESEVSTITNAGMFVNLIDNGASGLVPMRTISRGFASVDLNKHIIKDREGNRSFTLGDKVPVIIKEADEIRGMLTFLLDEDKMKFNSKKDFK